MDTRTEHLGVPFGERTGRADLATALGGVVHEELRLVDLLLQAAVDPVQVLLLNRDLPVPYRVDGFLHGHGAPF